MRFGPAPLEKRTGCSLDIRGLGYGARSFTPYWEIVGGMGSIPSSISRICSRDCPRPRSLRYASSRLRSGPKQKMSQRFRGHESIGGRDRLTEAHFFNREQFHLPSCGGKFQPKLFFNRPADRGGIRRESLFLRLGQFSAQQADTFLQRGVEA